MIRILFYQYTKTIIMKNIIFMSLCALFLAGCAVFTTRRSLSLPEKTVQCTFDDGPNAHGRTTEALLDVLKRHNVKGYFCVIGINVQRNPGIVKRIHDEGHAIVNHGYTDEFILFKSNKTIKKEILQCNNAISSALGIEDFSVEYYRPPRGFYRPSTRKILHELGMELLPFTVYALDAQRNHRDAHKVVQQTVKKIRKESGGAIVLHDGKDREEKLLKRVARDSTGVYNRAWIPEALDSIITGLKTEGFVFQKTN